MNLSMAIQGCFTRMRNKNVCGNYAVLGGWNTGEFSKEETNSL